MPDNTLTLRLSGEVTLAKFADAVDRFRSLITALTRTRKATRDITWIIADLQPGSAMTTIEGIGDIRRVLDVVEAYEEVGYGVERGTLDQFPPRVARPARNLRSLIGNGIESVTFETARTDIMIRAGDALHPQDQVKAQLVAPGGEILTTRYSLPARPLQPAYGAVSGQVETLARRGGLRFVIYDTLHNKAVSCYLTEGAEEQMRGVWGHWAMVEGLVTRDPVTGRPVSVREITRITPRPERATSYRDARGASPYTGILPEDLIRRIRDAG